jgi:hypothetical protein
VRGKRKREKAVSLSHYLAFSFAFSFCCRPFSGITDSQESLHIYWHILPSHFLSHSSPTLFVTPNQTTRSAHMYNQSMCIVNYQLFRRRQHSKMADRDQAGRKVELKARACSNSTSRALISPRVKRSRRRGWGSLDLHT